MGAAKIRKICTVVEETQTEMGRAIDPPTRKAVAVAIIVAVGLLGDELALLFNSISSEI